MCLYLPQFFESFSAATFVCLFNIHSPLSVFVRHSLYIPFNFATQKHAVSFDFVTIDKKPSLSNHRRTTVEAASNHLRPTKRSDF